MARNISICIIIHFALESSIFHSNQIATIITLFCVTRSQFHQQFTLTFFVQKFVQSQTLSREKLLKRLSYKKCEHKMLMKLTPSKEKKAKCVKF